MTNVIEVNEIRKKFILPLTRKKVTAIEDISFTVKEGGLVGFLGANGAGKTTTLKIILEFIFPDHGDVKIFGKSNSDISIKQSIGFLTERPYFYDYLTGREFLTFCAELFRDPEALKRVDSLLEEVGLSQSADRQLRRYSKGMLQRIGIAQALINNPKLIILDEPMSGLDPDGRAEISAIISKFHKRGATVIFSTHLLPDVEALCDRVVIIDKGKLVIESTVNDLLNRHSKGFLLEVKQSDRDQLTQKTFNTESQLQVGIDQARKNGETIIKVEAIRPHLEEVFLKLKRGEAI